MGRWELSNREGNTASNPPPPPPFSSRDPARKTTLFPETNATVKGNTCEQAYQATLRMHAEGSMLRAGGEPTAEAKSGNEAKASELCACWDRRSPAPLSVG